MKPLFAKFCGIVTLSIAISACGSPASSSNSNDAVLLKAAQRACEDVVNSENNLASFSKWVHHVTGDLNPTYVDQGTVYMDFPGRSGTKSFRCQGRVDPQSGMANAVMDGNLRSA